MKRDAVPHLWLVSSDYTGETNARVGVAERLGGSYEIIERVDLERVAGGAEHGGAAAARALGRSPPDVLLSGTGEDTVGAVLRFNAKLPRPALNVFLASILPDELPLDLLAYDLIAAPPHAELAARARPGQWTELLGVPHGVTPERLAAARGAWRQAYEAAPRPLVGLLVGGHTRYCSGFTADYGASLGRRVRALADAVDGSVVLTNSRRTPVDALTALRTALNPRAFAFHPWDEDASAGAYLGILACADILVATGDSLSMCCEAAATGKPLYIPLDTEATERYHRQIVERLFEAGAARPLSGRHRPWRATLIDPTGQVAAAVGRVLGGGPAGREER